MKTKFLSYKAKQLKVIDLTPIELFNRLQGTGRFLLESSSKFIPKGKYSFLGSNPYETIIGENNQTTVKQADDQTQTHDEHILSFIENNLPKINIDIPLPFYGGAVGYVGYDATNDHIDSSDPKENEPHSCLQVYRDVIVFDHINKVIHLITINIDKQQESILNERLANLQETVQLSSEPLKQQKKRRIKRIDFQAEQSKKQFLENITHIQQNIQKGDIEQAVISQRFTGEVTENPFEIYCALRLENPSPYMFYIEFTDHVVLGSSPESLIQTIGDQVITNPIAGTRPRGQSTQEDAELADSLINDPKEIAEHDMLVSLNKQELLQVCDPKSISFPIYKSVEKFQYVMHLVTEIHGRLTNNFTSFDALDVCLPAGTVSGTPKLEAMKLIQQLEQNRRWIYGGSIGYINFNHDLNMALAIRCLTVKDNIAYLQTGAGIVSDSDPETEYAETLQKAHSLLNLGQRSKEV